MYGFAIPCYEEKTESVLQIAENLRGFRELVRYSDSPNIAFLMFENESDGQSAFRVIDWEKAGTT